MLLLTSIWSHSAIINSPRATVTLKFRSTSAPSSLSQSDRCFTLARCAVDSSISRAIGVVWVSYLLFLSADPRFIEMKATTRTYNATTT